MSVGASGEIINLYPYFVIGILHLVASAVLGAGGLFYVYIKLFIRAKFQIWNEQSGDRIKDAIFRLRNHQNDFPVLDVRRSLVQSAEAYRYIRQNP